MFEIDINYHFIFYFLKVVKQAEAHTVYDIPLKGKLTSGENLSDLGGLRLALSAFKKSCGGNISTPLDADGFSPIARFFLSWATLWRQLIQEQRAKQLVTIDPHGPNDFRTNGPLSNMPEFYEAFGVTEGDPMWRKAEDRVDIW